MDDILKLGAAEMVDMQFECSCGRTHGVEIKKIIVDTNVDDGIIEVLEPFNDKRIMIVADENTFAVKGQSVKELLDSRGYNCKCFIFEKTAHLSPDEKSVGRLLIETDMDISLILAIGSGTINDIARIVAFRMKIPFIIIGTAPSMDGYASIVSPLIVNGMKTSYFASYPYAFIADLGVMSGAPHEMICAGFGDIMGKYTGLSDWKLSARINGEYLCKTSYSLVDNALKKCVENIAGIASRDVDAIKYMVEGLVLPGIAMGLTGDSRPASGSEHHLAHYWESRMLERGQDYPLHGNSVGVGTIVVSEIYQKVVEKYDLGFEVPKPSYLKGLLTKLGSADSPMRLGIDRDIFMDGILYAKNLRPRYTVLHLAESLDLLEKAAEILTEMYY